MNAPLMLVSNMQSGGGSPLGVLATKGNGADGTGVLAGDAAFASALVQAILGKDGGAATGQSNLLSAELLAKVTAAATDKPQIGDLLAALMDGTDTSALNALSGLLASPQMSAQLAELFLQLAPAETSGDKPQTGDLLANWLDQLQASEPSAEDRKTIDEMMALMELAAAVVSQWQPAADQPISAQGDEQLSAMPGAERQNATGTAEWLQTLRQLVDLHRKQPEQPEIKALVQSLEQLLAPQNKEQSAATAVNASAQTQTIVQTVSGQPSVTPVHTAAAVPLHSALKQKLAEKLTDAGAAPRAAASLAALAKGIDLKERLEAMAAKAGVQPSIAAVPAADDKVGDTANIASAETDHTSNASLQTSHLTRQQAPVQSAQPQAHVVHADRFIEEMAKAMKSLRTNAQSGLSEVRITLMPEHLGHVDVKVSLQNGQVIAQFVADSAHGKEMLESQLSQLRSMLQTQGLQVDRLVVSQSDPQPFQGSFQDAKQQQSQSDRRGKEHSANTEEDPADFLKQLESITGARPAVTDGLFDTKA
ncbi:flagellar hook-length control protein FliK [Paenibacillus ginsengarvi]|uniref:Flagellar hook-length control protein FliK n=1 Tax=Paenibacillus ginsengarvi TaxID=400777 RepID=A0A3B0CTV7_9BACL|nr:flagellar hook-length control protein FliK [Paenibacillus ginsengarvi]RKN86519.1 flagellar hook-length control protein FliK [Paenibacillus ginsengarvi]